MFWGWLWRFSSDRMKYEIRRLGGVPTDYTQGETPVPVLEAIAALTGMLPGMRVLDLGCGRGSALAYWAIRYSIVPIGIEAIPIVGETAEWTLRYLGVPGTIMRGDLESIEWPVADVIVVAGTCFSTETTAAIRRQMRRCQAGTTLVAISVELPVENWVLVKTIPARFAWGETMIRVYNSRPC